MSDTTSVWILALPPAVAAWAGAIALGYLLILPGATRPVRYWAIGFVLLGGAVLLNHLVPLPDEAAHLVSVALASSALLVIGFGLLIHFGTPIHRGATVAVGGAILIPLGLLHLSPDLGLAACWIAHLLHAAIALGLGLGLGAYCIARCRRQSGTGLRFLGAVFLLSTAQPLLEHLHFAWDPHGLVGLGLDTIVAVALPLGLAIVALRRQQIRAADSEDRPRYFNAIRDVLKGTTDMLNVEFRLNQKDSLHQGDQWLLSRGVAVRRGTVR